MLRIRRSNAVRNARHRPLRARVACAGAIAAAGLAGLAPAAHADVTVSCYAGSIGLNVDPLASAPDWATDYWIRLWSYDSSAGEWGVSGWTHVRPDLWNVGIGGTSNNAGTFQYPRGRYIAWWVEKAVASGGSWQMTGHWAPIVQYRANDHLTWTENKTGYWCET